MPAKLVVTSGPEAGTEHPIEKGVIRVGSSPQCDCVLDDDNVAEHALTLQRRGKLYRVFNKTDGQLALDGKAFEAGESRSWKPGTHLHLSENVTVCLVVDDSRVKAHSAVDSLFARTAEEAAVEEPAESDAAKEAADEAAEPAKGFSAKDAVYLGITAAVIAGTVLLGMYDPDAKPGGSQAGKTGQNGKITLVELLQRVKTSEAVKNPIHPAHSWMSRVSSELHDAWRSRGSGDEEGACAHFRVVSQLLLENGKQEPGTPGRFKEKLSQQIYDFTVGQCSPASE